MPIEKDLVLSSRRRYQDLLVSSKGITWKEARDVTLTTKEKLGCSDVPKDGDVNYDSFFHESFNILLRQRNPSILVVADQEEPGSPERKKKKKKKKRSHRSKQSRSKRQIEEGEVSEIENQGPLLVEEDNNNNNNKSGSKRNLGNKKENDDDYQQEIAPAEAMAVEENNGNGSEHKKKSRSKRNLGEKKKSSKKNLGSKKRSRSTRSLVDPDGLPSPGSMLTKKKSIKNQPEGMLLIDIY